MKWLWCWRCRSEMPMLDEAEYAAVVAKRKRDPEQPLSKHIQFLEVLNEYERITGYHETNPNAIYHHRLSLYGSPCKKCGRPLRTPKAKLCGSCMTPVEGIA